MPTEIEWCDETWNPVTGCTAVGEGCLNCYARAMAHRFPKRFGGLAEPFKVTCHLDRLDAKVLRKRKPQRIFVCSMGDLFHEKVPRKVLALVWTAMATHTRHIFIVLTKRPKRMLAWVNWVRFWARGCPSTGIEPNIWLGVSVSTQREADELIPILLQCPAAKRIVSYEPALGYVDWKPFIKDLDWLICGCESGPKRRPFEEHWARWAQMCCAKAGVPFFFNQGRDERNRVVKMPLLDGRRYKESPR